MKIRKIHGPFFFVYLALNFDHFFRCHKSTRTQTNLSRLLKFDPQKWPFRTLWKVWVSKITKSISMKPLTMSKMAFLVTLSLQKNWFHTKLIRKAWGNMENFLSPKFVMWNQFAEYLLSTKTDVMEFLLVKTQVLAIFES